MGLFDVGSATTTDLNNSLTKVSIGSQDTDYGRYTPDWSKWHGRYREVARLQAIIDKIACWAIGGKIKAKEQNKQKTIDSITGFGKDTPQDIGQNLIRTADICGDSFSEIIWLNDRKDKLNLKPLNPGSLEIVTNNKGILIGYNQLQTKQGADGKIEITRVLNPDGFLPTFAPNEIFHLPRMRIADEPHGIGVIERIEDIVLKKKEAQEIMQKIVKRNAKPIVIIEADTDNPTEMADLKTKYKDLIENDEAMIVPKDSIKLLDFASKLNIDFMPWLSYLDKEILLAEGVPEVILGVISSKDTEGASKILYLAWEQVVKDKQNWFKEQWNSQIGFEIELEEPPSIDPMILTDSRKAGSFSAEKGNKTTDVNPAGENK